MAENKKGLKIGMAFNVGEEPDVEERGPLLPLRILVVSDLIPDDQHNAGASAPEGAVRIDPNGFDELFTRLRPRIAIDVPSVLAEGRAARIDLAPSGFKSLRPDGLVSEVPLLRSLLDGKLVLERLRDGTVTREVAVDELSRLWPGSPFAREILGLMPGTGGSGQPATVAAPAAAAPSAVDSILDMVDVGGGGGAAPAAVSLEPGVPAAPHPPIDEEPSRFTALIAAVAKSARSGAGGGRVAPHEAIRRVEQAIGTQIGAILQHREVRRLEEAWRGLKFLADRAQGVPGLKIDVVSARSDKAAAALKKAIKANASGEPPVSFALVDVRIDNSAASLARAHALAEVAEELTVPVILAASNGLLGVRDLAEIEQLDYKQNLFLAKQQVAWQSLAYKPEMRWVVFALNEILARAPYDKTTSRVREATVTELPNDEGGFVWTSPIYAIGALAVASFKDTGWACRIVGPKAGTLPNLPVHQQFAVDESAEGVAIPTRAYITTDSQRELGKMGIFALASAPNSDAVQVLSAPTAYVTPPKKTYDSATTEAEVRYERVPLGDQLFVARVVQFLRAFCSKLPASSPPDQAGPVVEGALWTLFEGAPPGIEIAVKAAFHEGHGTSAAVTIRPRRFLGVALEELSLEMPLG